MNAQGPREGTAEESLCPPITRFCRSAAVTSDAVTYDGGIVLAAWTVFAVISGLIGLLRGNWVLGLLLGLMFGPLGLVVTFASTRDGDNALRPRRDEPSTHW